MFPYMAFFSRWLHPFPHLIDFSHTYCDPLRQKENRERTTQLATAHPSRLCFAHPACLWLCLSPRDDLHNYAGRQKHGCWRVDAHLVRTPHPIPQPTHPLPTLNRSILTLLGCSLALPGMASYALVRDPPTQVENLLNGPVVTTRCRLFLLLPPFPLSLFINTDDSAACFPFSVRPGAYLFARPFVTAFTNFPFLEACA